MTPSASHHNPRELEMPQRRQWLTTRRQGANCWTNWQQRLRQVGARVDEVLAVVKNQKQAPGPEQQTQRLEQRRAWPLAYSERLRHRVRYERRYRQWSELRNGDAIVVLGADGSGHLECESRLADASWTSQCQQAIPLE